MEASAAPRIIASSQPRPSSCQPASPISTAGIRLGAQHQQGETPLSSDLAHIHRDGIAEQHQDQGEGGDDLEGGRLEREGDQPESGGAEQAPSTRKMPTWGSRYAR